MISVDRPSRPRFVKLTAIAVSFSFLFNQILFAHLPETTIWAERRSVILREPKATEESRLCAVKRQRQDPSPSAQDDIKQRLLTQFGVVRDSFETGSQPPLLIIQDIHLNYEAQSNVIKMLDQLRSEGRLGTIAVEGASGPFDFRPFFKAGDQAVRRRVAEAFLKENRISAPSFVGVIAGALDTRIVGVDDDALYEANVQAYLKSRDVKERLAAGLRVARRELLQEKKAVFNSALWNLDRMVASYDAGALSLGALLEKLDASAPALKRFLEVYRLERTIDFDRAEAERRQLLSGRQASLDETPMLAAYLCYAALAEGVNAVELIRGTRQAIAASLDKLAKTDREKELVAASRTLLLQERLIKFELTLEEWNEYKSVMRGNDDLKPFEDFYRLADHRSDAMVKNVLRASPSVLIMGGFHSPHVTGRLKERGVSYVVMSPKITSLEAGSGSAYLSVFDRQKTPLEKLFAGVKLTLLPAQTLLGSSAPRAERINKDFIEAENERKSYLERLRELAANFESLFRQQAQILLERFEAGVVVGSDRKEAEALLNNAEEAFDWRNKWVARQKYYKAFKKFPPTLLSMEGRQSAFRIPATPEEAARSKKYRNNRITSAQGGLGDLFGGWISMLARLGLIGWIRTAALLGFKEARRLAADAPKAYIFMPDNQHGARYSRRDPWGWPVSDHKDEAWRAIRPQDHGIDLVPDPDNPSKPLTIQVPLHDPLGFVNVQYRVVKHAGAEVIMISTDANEDEAKRKIFRRLYDGDLGSDLRFCQQWVYGLAVQKFQEKFGMEEGPLHMNETATFAVMLGRIVSLMEKHVGDGLSPAAAYELAMKRAGSQIVFFTHTLVDEGIDVFFRGNVPLISYFKALANRSEILAPHKTDVAEWLLHGKPSRLYEADLPGFLFYSRRHQEHYSPLNFIVRLAYQFGGTVAAVSRLNAVKAGQLLSGDDYPVLSKEQIAAKPVRSATNAVFHPYFLPPELVDLMGLNGADPEKFETHKMLDPKDPQARELAAKIQFELPQDYKASALSDDKLAAHINGWRANAIDRIRWGVKQEHIRNIHELTHEMHSFKSKSNPEHHAAVKKRLDTLKHRWTVWTGQPFSDYLEEMENQELTHLLDKETMTAVWARRIVPYKRSLYALFGKHLPLVETEIYGLKLEIEKTGRDITVDDLDDIIKAVRKAGGYENLESLFADFLKKIEDPKAPVQFVFAGPTFQFEARMAVALMDRVQEHLEKAHPLLTKRSVFVEGYDDELSVYLRRGADLWINTPRRPEEASGTSGMKGGVDLTSPDGWAADNLFDGLNGFLFTPKSMPRTDHPRNVRNMDIETRDRYLREEAESFYEKLSEASALFYGDKTGWLRLFRRSIFYKVDVFGDSFRDRYIPSADPQVSQAGMEYGIFDIYKGSIKNMVRVRRELKNDKKIARVVSHVEFLSRQSQIQVDPVSREVTAAIRLRVPESDLSEVDICSYWGHDGYGDQWRPKLVARDKMIYDPSTGVLTVNTPVPVEDGDDAVITFFAVPSGLGGEKSPERARVYAGRYIGDNSHIVWPPKMNVLRARGASPGPALTDYQLRHYTPERLSSLIRKKDHVLLIPKSKDPIELKHEIRMAELLVRRQEDAKLVVMLRENEPSKIDNFKKRGVSFINEADLREQDAVERKLLSLLAGDGRLALLVHDRKNLPLFLIEELLRLGRQESYVNKVRFILANDLRTASMAVEASSLLDMRALMKFIELVGSQA